MLIRMSPSTGVHKWFLYRPVCPMFYIKDAFPFGEGGPPKAVDEVLLCQLRVACIEAGD